MNNQGHQPILPPNGLPPAMHVGRMMDGHYRNQPGSYYFASASSPTLFAIDLVGRYMGSLLGSSQKPLAADLGCGNGRDAECYARVGFQVIPTDVSNTARIIALDKVRNVGEMSLSPLSERVRTIEDICHLSDGSLALGSGVSSHHYRGPDWLMDMLATYARVLYPGGVIGLALKTPASSWPTELKSKGRAPDRIYNLQNISNSWNGITPEVPGYTPEDSVPRVFYTGDQVEGMFKLAGLHVVHRNQIQLSDYDRNGTEIFAWVVGTPKRHLRQETR